MTKSELVEAVASKAEISKKDAASAVNAVIDAITETLVAGDKVALPGFGTFAAVEKPESTATNPRTGEKVVVPAHKSPKFKAGAGLKAAVK